MAFVDIHSHLLPGIDDGAQSFGEAVEMLEFAQASGTTQIVATPHMFAPGLGSDDVDRVRAAYESFVARLETHVAGGEGATGDIRPALGAENYVSTEFLEAMDEDRVLTLAGSRSLLLEFWPLTTASAVGQALDRIQAAGYLPVLAHVERYRFLHEQPAALEALVASGVIAQVNASAILGQQGLGVAQLVARWLRRGLISVVASDSHGVASRPPALDAVHAHLDSRYGEATADLCLRANPLALLADSPPARPPETRRFRWWRRSS